MGTVSPIIKVTLMSHIHNRLKDLERRTNGVACCQFAVHPDGLSFVVRIYLPQAEKEFTYPDCIIPSELCDSSKENQRIDVLFDCIVEALNSVQGVTSTSNGLIIH